MLAHQEVRLADHLDADQDDQPDLLMKGLQECVLEGEEALELGQRAPHEEHEPNHQQQEDPDAVPPCQGLPGGAVFLPLAALVLEAGGR